MNSKQSAAFAGLLLCASFLTGCFPTVGVSDAASEDGYNAQTYMTQNGTSADFPDHIESRNNEKLNIDADVFLPANFDPATLSCSTAAVFKPWTKEQVIDAFADGHAVTDESTHENSGPDDLIHVLTLDNDSDLVYADGEIWYNTATEKELDYAYYFDNFEYYIRPDTMAQVFGDGEISGLDKSTVIGQVNSMLEKIDLKDSVGEPTVCTITSETVNQIIHEQDLKERDGQQTPDWTSDQDAYLLVYPYLYTNLPAIQINAMGDNELYCNGNIWFVYGKEGLITCRLSSITVPAEENETAPLLTPQDAANRTEDFFRDIIIDAPLNISTMKLGFVVRTSTNDMTHPKMIPVWMVYGSHEVDEADLPDDADEKKKAPQKANYLGLVDAVTGENLKISSIGGL